MSVHVDPEWDTGMPVGSTRKTIRINGHPGKVDSVNQRDW